MRKLVWRPDQVTGPTAQPLAGSLQLSGIPSAGGAVESSSPTAGCGAGGPTQAGGCAGLTLPCRVVATSAAPARAPSLGAAAKQIPARSAASIHGTRGGGRGARRSPGLASDGAQEPFGPGARMLRKTLGSESIRDLA
jgi:hypothetical protein